jgi:hypothetical protein
MNTNERIRSFFSSSNLVVRNSILKENKWDDRGSNPDPLHTQFIILPIELSSHERIGSVLNGGEENDIVFSNIV